MPIANPTYYKRVKLSSDKTAFYFDSLGEVNRFIKEKIPTLMGNAKQAYDNLVNKSIIQRALNRREEALYGTMDLSWMGNPISTFLFNNELDNFMQSVRRKTINFNVTDLDQSKRIQFTEREIGIFSFDLASLGLIPVVDFYSPILNKNVSGNLVRSIKNKAGELVYYHIYQPSIPEHIVNYDANKNGYYSDVLKIIIPKIELQEKEIRGNIVFIYPAKEEVQQHDVERRQRVDENGLKKYSTTWKKSFVYIPKVEKPLPRIDIIINSSYTYKVHAKNEMIYSSMPAIALAEKLSNSGVNYRIVSVFSGKDKDKNAFYPFVVLKKEGEILDKNKMAILTSDARFYRQESFKLGISAMEDAGYRDGAIDTNGLFYPIIDKNEIKQAYIEYLKKSGDPADFEASKNERSKIVFSGALSESMAVSEYDRIIDEISKV